MRTALLQQKAHYRCINVMINKIAPIGSVYFKGLRVIFFSFFGITSPNAVETAALVNSWQVVTAKKERIPNKTCNKIFRVKNIAKLLSFYMELRSCSSFFRKTASLCLQYIISIITFQYASISFFYSFF